MGQLVIVDEEEYQNLKIKANWYNLISDEIDYFANELYPDAPYWTDCGSGIDVANQQLRAIIYCKPKRKKKILFGFKKDKIK